MTTRQKKQWKDQAMYGVVGMIAFSLYQLNKDLKGHIEGCTQASKTLRNVVIGVGIIVMAQLIINFFGFFHFGPTVVNTVK